MMRLIKNIRIHADRRMSVFDGSVLIYLALSSKNITGMPYCIAYDSAGTCLNIGVYKNRQNANTAIGEILSVVCFLFIRDSLIVYKFDSSFCRHDKEMCRRVFL